jgi:HSP20 family molecular chaperone IbpA
VLRFPVDIEDAKVEAKYESGILKVTLPKAAAALPRRIEVKG